MSRFDLTPFDASGRKAMPLLADHLLASREVISAESDWLLLRKEMKEAHIFELDADFAEAADQLKSGNPSAFEKILPLCRLPYDICWFEVRHEDRESFVKGVRRPTDAGDVDRVGALIERLGDSHQWMMSLSWRLKDGAMSLSDIAMVIDFSENPQFSGKEKPSERERLSTIYTGADLDAATNLDRRVMPYPGRFHSLEFGYAADKNQRLLSSLNRAEGDWAGEWMFWMAVVALINSRNVVATEAVDMTRENIRRRRVSNRRPDLLSYTRCLIAPRLKARIEADRKEQGETGLVRAHFVRGHFKARKSGLFWWKPFLRGNQRRGFVDKDYQVTR